MIFDLGAGTYDCDCTDFPIYKLQKAYPDNILWYIIRCRRQNFHTSMRQSVYSYLIPLNQFVCELSNGCPSSCRCVYRPANATLHVYCSAANLSSLPLDLPPLPKSYVKYKLDFSNNKLLQHLEHRPYFFNTSILDVSNCSLTDITVNFTKDLSRLSLVNFRGNVLQSFPRQANTVNISTRLLIGDNPWRCSCDNSWMIGWIQSLSHHISDPGDIFCRSPSRMYSRNVLKSTKEDICCPSSCRCVYPGNATLNVYCSAANLSSLPHDLPPLPKSYVKYKVDFSSNKFLRRLERRPYFVNTSILDVSNCSLTGITLVVLKDMASFSLVNFRGNLLESFPRQVDTVNISARLLIGDNPWMCSCDNSWMIGWLQSLSHQIVDQGDVVCRSPSRMYGRNVLKSTAEEFCADRVNSYLIIIVTLAVVLSTVILVVISRIILYKLRIILNNRWQFHPFDRDECVGEDMDYDVFLCCSSLDDDPHGSRILSEMESNGYRVCYHERDFLPGQLITDNMGHGIERSKRTVCLISNNFLRR